MARLQSLRERLSEALWVAPTLGLLVAIALAALTIEIDGGIAVGDGALIGFGGGPDSARSILSTIAASMLTFLALVFTLTVVALQLASDFSPRLLSSFLSARVSKTALALFVTTFTYAVLILREVAPEDVPELSVTVAIVLAILSVLVFVYYVSEIAQSLRLANIVDRAGAATRDEIAAMPDDGEPGAEQRERELGWSAIEGAEARTLVRWADGPGVVTTLDLEGMRALAEELEATLELRMAVGDFLTTGAPTVAVYGGEVELAPERVDGLMATANERTFSQDPAFGLRQLTDIAARALSPGTNDPTTAVQALDQLHDALLRLGGRQLPSGVLRGSGDRVRVLLPVPSWEDYLGLSLDEIRIYGEGSLQVSRRLRTLLEDLRDRLPAARHPPIATQLRLLDRSVEAGFGDAADRRRAGLASSPTSG
jgi:uncharacterized membrane protein